MTTFSPIPVVFEGISIVSAILFTIIFTAAPIYFWWDNREHARLNKLLNEKNEELSGKIDILFRKVDDTNKTMSEVQVMLARIETTVEAIKFNVKRK